jgi:hypothetical protein
MIKRLDHILNGKGGVGKCYNCLLYFLSQTLKTAVGRLVLYKPFLATAVWSGLTAPPAAVGCA